MDSAGLELRELTIFAGGACHGTSRNIPLERCEDCGHPSEHEGMDATRGNRTAGRGCVYGVNNDGAGIRCGCRGRARIPRVSKLLDVDEVYVRFPCTFISANPIVNTQPDLVFVRDIYLWSGFYADHNFDNVHPAAQEFIMQAVTQWWLQTVGFVSKADGGPVVAAQSPNGSPPAVWYIATCEDCAPVAVDGKAVKMPFVTLKERAEWARAHMEGAGHKLTMSEEPRTTTVEE